MYWSDELNDLDKVNELNEVDELDEANEVNELDEVESTRTLPEWSSSLKYSRMKDTSLVSLGVDFEGVCVLLAMIVLAGTLKRISEPTSGWGRFRAISKTSLQKKIYDYFLWNQIFYTSS